MVLFGELMLFGDVDVDVDEMWFGVFWFYLDFVVGL